MSSLDDLLQQLENQHMSKTPPPPENASALDEQLAALQQQSQLPQPNQPQPAETATSSEKNTNLDANLAALQQDTTQAETKSVSPNKNTAIDDNLAMLQQQVQSKPVPTSAAVDDTITAMLSSLEKSSVEQKLKATQQNHQICQAISQVIEAKKQQPKLQPHDLEAIALSEKQKQQREKYWQTKAQTWLKELDPLSNEGMWFTDFADGYESRLDAAIDYLMALE